MSAESYPVAEARARASKRAILVHFHTSWCGWCRRMEKDTYGDSRVAARSKRDFVFLAVDAEAEGKKLARKHRVSSYPTALLLTVEGTEIGRIEGYRNVERFLADLDRISSSRRELEEMLAKEKASPDDPQLQFDLAMALERAKRDGDALERYEAIVANEANAAAPFRDLALWNLASLHRRQDDGERSLRAYRKFVAAYPESRKVETATYQIGRIEQSLGRFERALTAYRSYLSQFPSSRRAARVRMQIELIEAGR